MGKVKQSLIEFQDKITDDAIKVIDDLIKDRLGGDNGRPLNINFSVQATLWNDHTYISRELIPMWFDDDTKNKIRQVIKEFYEGLSEQEIKEYNK